MTTTRFKRFTALLLTLLLTLTILPAAFAEGLDSAGAQELTPQGDAATVYNIKEALSLADGTAFTVKGQITYRFMNYSYPDCALIEDTIDGQRVGLFVYFNPLTENSAGEPLSIGDWVVLTGTMSVYGGVSELASVTSVVNATAEQQGVDSKEPQVYENLTDLINDWDNLISEQVFIKNVKLGAYNTSSTKTTLVDPNDPSITVTIYKAAAYPIGVSAGELVNVYAAVSKYNTTKQLRNGASSDYVVLSDEMAPVITLPTFLDGEVGVDYPVTVTVQDNYRVASVALSYTVGDTSYGPVAMIAGANDEYSFTIPASQIVMGTKSIALSVTAVDAWATPNTSDAVTGSIAIIDLPRLLSFAPLSNSESGENKRPLITATVGNAGVGYTAVLKLDGEAVAATVDGDTISYQPDADMADGQHAVALTITRADEAFDTFNWKFYVGEAQMELYFGQLHSHTAEYSDGSGTLEQAYEHAMSVQESANVDFLAVTDHSNYFDTSSNLGDMTDASKGTATAAGDQTKWQEAKATAAYYNGLSSSFVALYGYEMTWSGQYGHMNTFNSVGIESRNNSAYVVKNGPGLVAYYDRLVAVSADNVSKGLGTVLNQFNHPGSTFGTFEDFAHYTAAYDELITMVEVGNGEGKVGGSFYWPSYEYYTMALDKGWHVAPTNNQDNHKGNWGDSNTARDVIYTDNFSEEGIYECMRNMTMYSTEDNDLEIYYTLNGSLMGSRLEDTDEVTLNVEFNDPTDRVATVSVIVNGGVTLYQQTFNTKSGSFTKTFPDNYDYYYIRVDEVDADIAVTAPVWVGNVTKIGISTLEKDTVVETVGDPITFTTTFFNSELPLSGEESTAADMVLSKIDYVLNGDTVYSDTTGYTVPSNTATFPVTWVYTPAKLGGYAMNVNVTALYRGNEYHFTVSTSFTALDGENMLNLLIDANHKNFYVSGNYANDDAALVELAADYGVRASRLNTAITDEALADCDLLVLTVPYNGSGAAVTNYLYTEAELAALGRYAARGGNLVVCSKSDRREPAAANEKAAVISNGILAAIGAKARIGTGIVADSTNMTNESYRLHFVNKGFYNFESWMNENIMEKTNSLFSCYNAAPVLLNGATEVLKAFDTSIVSSFDTYYGNSNSYMPKDTDRSASYYEAAAASGQTDIVVIAEETLSGGGFLVTSGVTFFSTYEVQTELENAGTLQNANYQMVVNLLKKLKKVTPIATVQQEGIEGLEYVVEGYVTSNASGYDKDTAFFDCIYVQDESGRGINVFPVAGYYEIGSKVRVTGKVSYYQGEIELNCTEVDDLTLTSAEKAELETLNVVMADKQTVTSATLDDSLTYAAIDEKAAENAKLIEPAVPGTETDYLSIIGTGAAMGGDFTGNLIEIYGKVTAVENDSNGVLGVIKVDDGTGEAVVYIDGYINCNDCAAGVQHDLSDIAAGDDVRVRGIASIGQNSYSDGSATGPRIRIRNRVDIEKVTETEIPIYETGITVAAMPTKTEYVAGETFDPAGMVIIMLYSDRTSDVVTDYAYSTEPLQAGETYVVITAGKYTVKVHVTVKNPNLYGDANCDTVVNAPDAAAVLRYVVKLIKLSDQGLINGKVTLPVNGNNEINAGDAAAILRYTVKLIKEFPVEIAH